jgi:hypothetical protein
MKRFMRLLNPGNENGISLLTYIAISREKIMTKKNPENISKYVALAIDIQHIINMEK